VTSSGSPSSGQVTAYGDDERRRKASKLGAVEFLTKPVDFGLLKDQLRRLSSAAS